MPTPERRQLLARIAAFLFVVALMAAAYIFRDQMHRFAHLGYLSAFLMPLLANATVFLPIPGVMMIFTMGGLFNPLWVAVLGGLGAATGELTGYLVGFSGQGLVEHARLAERIKAWMTAHPHLTDLAVTVLAIIPNPFFDAAGIAAGSLKMPVWRFLLFCALGSIIKMLGFAFAGSTSIEWLFGPGWGR